MNGKISLRKLKAWTHKHTSIVPICIPDPDIARLCGELNQHEILITHAAHNETNIARRLVSNHRLHPKGNRFPRRAQHTHADHTKEPTVRTRDLFIRLHPRRREISQIAKFNFHGKRRSASMHEALKEIKCKIHVLVMHCVLLETERIIRSRDNLSEKERIVKGVRKRKTSPRFSKDVRGRAHAYAKRFRLRSIDL